MFRTFFVSLILVCGLSSISPVFAACPAADTASPAAFIAGCAQSATGAVPPGGDGDGREDTRRLVRTVANSALSFGALFAIGAIVFSGIRYTTSAGEDEKLKSAKNTAIYALIGLLLLLVSFPLVDIFIRFIFTVGASS